MMATITFDTQELVTKLKAAGFAPEQADAVVRVIVDSHEELVTKADLKTGLADLKGEIQAMLNRHLLAIMGAMVGLTAIFSGVLLIALRLVK